jgi:antirestriction protein ArdC
MLAGPPTAREGCLRRGAAVTSVGRQCCSTAICPATVRTRQLRATTPRRPVSAHATTVFNVAQVDGSPNRPASPPVPLYLTPAFGQFVAATSTRFLPGDTDCYLPRLDRIRIRYWEFARHADRSTPRRRPSVRRRGNREERPERLQGSAHIDSRVSDGGTSP